MPCEDPEFRAVLRPGVPAGDGSGVSSSEVSATYCSHPSKVSVSVDGGPWKLPTLSAHTKANKTVNNRAKKAADGLQLPILMLKFKTRHHEFQNQTTAMKNVPCKLILDPTCKYYSTLIFPCQQLGRERLSEMGQMSPRARTLEFL